MDIQQRIASAWIALAQGRQNEAVTMLREAADMEDLTDKSAISPGPIKPARELLGEMLLELKRPAEALKEFEATMAKEPNRFRGVYGAARGRRRRRRSAEGPHLLGEAHRDLPAGRQSRTAGAAGGAEDLEESVASAKAEAGRYLRGALPAYCWSFTGSIHLMPGANVNETC